MELRMQVFGYISLVVTLSAGVWAHGDRIDTTQQEPSIAGFLPGNWQHSPLPNDNEGCN